MNPLPNAPGTAEASPFNTPHEKNTETPLMGAFRLSQQGILFDTPSTPRTIRTGDKRPSAPLMDTSERPTQQVRLLHGAVDKQEELRTAILQRSGVVEEIARALDARVAKLEAALPITAQEMARLLDERVTRSQKTMAQTAHNDSVRALRDKVAALEATLNHYKEKSAQYEERYGSLAAGPQNRGDAVKERGAGGAAPPPAAPQPRIGSEGAEDQDMGIAATVRGAGRAAPLLGAPQPSVGMENKRDQRGARSNISEDKGNTHPAKPVAARPPTDPPPQEVLPLTTAQTYAAATPLSLTNNDDWQTQLSKHQKCQAKKPATIFVPAKDLPLEARRLIFSRRVGASASPKPDQELTAAINNCLYMKRAPHFHQVAHVTRNSKGTITATSAPGVDAKTLITHYWNEMVNAIREVDRAVLDVHELEKWIKLKVHGIPLNRFMGRGTHGVQKLQLEIQANHHDVQVLPSRLGIGRCFILTRSTPYEKSKSLGCGGSMVARLKLKGIDGRAPPGLEPAA
jgi:hypothetical protein